LPESIGVNHQIAGTIRTIVPFAEWKKCLYREELIAMKSAVISDFLLLINGNQENSFTGTFNPQKLDFSNPYNL